MSAETRNLELYNVSENFLDIYPNYDLSVLPDWVCENIDKARVYGNSKQGIILPDGRKYHLKNKLNDMTGKEWTFYINSVFSTHYPTRGKEAYAHEIRKVHPSPKPPQLMRDIIYFFTKKNELVFDSFMGVGGTLLGAALAGRVAAGIELNPKYVAAYKESTEDLELPEFPTVIGDTLELTRNHYLMEELLGDKEISLLLIDPPYANMMSREKTGGDMVKHGVASTPFTNDFRDLGNMEEEEFLESLKLSIEQLLPYVKAEGYVVVFIKDLQPKKKKLNLLHYDVANKINEIPKLYYKGMKIWSDESAKLYPYGYPFSFVANQIHQYILVFRKEKR